MISAFSLWWYGLVFWLGFDQLTYSQVSTEMSDMCEYNSNPRYLGINQPSRSTQPGRCDKYPWKLWSKHACCTIH